MRAVCVRCSDTDRQEEKLVAVVRFPCRAVQVALLFTCVVE